MKDKAILKFNILAIISIIIMVFCVTPITFQNDTFYTIKIGEQIAQNGIDMLEHFSWHEGLEYTYPHWLFDLIVYHIYNLFDFTGLYMFTVILGTVLGVVLYFANVKVSKNYLCSLIISLLTLIFLRGFITARAQLVTFILFALTYYCIECFLESKKKRYIVGLITIPILIANFHLAVFPFYFVIYLPYIAEYIFANSIEESIYKKKRIKKLEIKISKLSQKGKLEDKEYLEKELERIKDEDKEENKSRILKVLNKMEIVKKDAVKVLIIVMIICLFTGFLTPLGATPYTYLLKTMQGDTTSGILEHLPLILITNAELLAILVLFFAIMIFTNVKIRISDICMFGGLLFLSIMSRRQVSMFFLLCMFFFNKLVSAFINNYSDKIVSQADILKRMTSKLGIFAILICVLNIGVIGLENKIGTKYIDETLYPTKACDFIVENLDLNNVKLYNEYNYGSYLILRDIPVYIDSRADLYTPEFNEGIDVFNEHSKISTGKEHYEPIFEKYGITHVLLKNDSLVNHIISNTDLEKYTQLYTDEYFTLYQRNNI